MSWRHATVGGLRVPPAEVDCILILVLGTVLKVVVLILVAAPELTFVPHRQFLDGQTLLYLDLGHAQLLLPALLDLRRLLHLQLPLGELMRKQVLHGHFCLFRTWVACWSPRWLGISWLVHP